MEAYSLLLLVALLGLGVSLAGALFRGRKAGVATGGVVVAWLSALAALVVHLLSGHRPGTREALPAMGLVAEHPTLFGALAAATGLLIWRVRGGSR